jgi:hypothetical protein
MDKEREYNLVRSPRGFAANPGNLHVVDPARPGHTYCSKPCAAWLVEHCARDGLAASNRAGCQRCSRRAYREHQKYRKQLPVSGGTRNAPFSHRARARSYEGSTGHGGT